jgi:hypothetical protein
MSLCTALKGAVADARPLQNPDFRRLWVTQIITMIGVQLPAARLEGQADTRRPGATTGCGVDLRRSAVGQRLVLLVVVVRGVLVRVRAASPSKDNLGLDQCQARLYTAIQRHIMLVMAALAICAVTAALLRDRTAPRPRRQRRQARPRRATQS